MRAQCDGWTNGELTPSILRSTHSGALVSLVAESSRSRRVRHSADALEPPVDPVLDQLDNALRSSGHTTRRLAVDDAVQPLINELTKEEPDLIFNLAESFRGKSALESNVAALLNLLDLRYTGSSPAGLSTVRTER